MVNRHIKLIKGRRYYYESIRKGKKVTSRYIGPVVEKAKKKEATEADLVMPVDSYIG